MVFWMGPKAPTVLGRYCRDVVTRWQSEAYQRYIRTARESLAAVWRHLANWLVAVFVCQCEARVTALGGREPKLFTQFGEARTTIGCGICRWVLVEKQQLYCFFWLILFNILDLLCLCTTWKSFTLSLYKTHTHDRLQKRDSDLFLPRCQGNLPV